MNMTIRLTLIFALALVLSGCKETIYAKLQEREANEVVAALYSAGIQSAKSPLKDDLFAVSVNKVDFGAALIVLSKAGLPRETFRTIGEVFPDDNVVGTPFEERARFSFALSQELSRTITEIEGIQFTRVHVVINEKGRFDDEARPSKAALAVYHASDFDPGSHIPQMKKLIAFSVPNLAYDDVSISLFPADEASNLMLEAIGQPGAAHASGFSGPALVSSTGSNIVAFLLLTALGLLVITLFLWLVQGVLVVFRGFARNGK